MKLPPVFLTYILITIIPSVLCRAKPLNNNLTENIEQRNSHYNKTLYSKSSTKAIVPFVYPISSSLQVTKAIRLDSSSSSSKFPQGDIRATRPVPVSSPLTLLLDLPSLPETDTDNIIRSNNNNKAISTNTNIQTNNNFSTITTKNSQFHQFHPSPLLSVGIIQGNIDPGAQAGGSGGVFGRSDREKELFTYQSYDNLHSTKHGQETRYNSAIQMPFPAGTNSHTGIDTGALTQKYHKGQLNHLNSPKFKTNDSSKYSKRKKSSDDKSQKAELVTKKDDERTQTFSKQNHGNDNQLKIQPKNHKASSREEQSESFVSNPHPLPNRNEPYINQAQEGIQHGLQTQLSPPSTTLQGHQQEQPFGTVYGVPPLAGTMIMHSGGNENHHNYANSQPHQQQHHHHQQHHQEHGHHTHEPHKYHHHHHHHHEHKEEEEEKELIDIEDKVFTKTIIGTKALKKGSLIVVFFLFVAVLIFGAITATGTILSPVSFPLALIPIGLIALALFVPLLIIFFPFVAAGLGGRKKRSFNLRSSKISEELLLNRRELFSTIIESNLDSLLSRLSLSS